MSIFCIGISMATTADPHNEIKKMQVQEQGGTPVGGVPCHLHRNFLFIYLGPKK
jgi:hypothetical protein